MFAPAFATTFVALAWVCFIVVGALWLPGWFL